MKEYVMTLIGTVLVTSLVSIVVPEGKLTKYVRLVATLCILSVSISPLYSFMSALTDGEYGDIADRIFGDVAEGAAGDLSDIYEENLLEAGAANMSASLKSMLCRDMGLSADRIDVYVKLCEGEDRYLPEGVSVVLYGTAVFVDPREIESYVRSLLGCGCEIVYG